MTSPFYASCIQGATPVAEALGYELIVMAPESEDDYATQTSMMEDFITQGVKGIAVCGINLDALIPAIQKANAAGIPVVMFNTITEIEGADVYAYSGYNQYNESVDASGFSSKVKLTLTINVRYTNNTNHEEDFEQKFSAFQTYDSSKLLTQVQDELITVMVKDITEQIFNATVANW